MGTCYQAGRKKPPTPSLKLCEKGNLKDVSKMEERRRLERAISYEIEDMSGNGAEGQTRTVDTGIFSAVLYHLSYLGQRLSS